MKIRERNIPLKGWTIFIGLALVILPALLLLPDFAALALQKNSNRASGRRAGKNVNNSNRATASRVTQNANGQVSNSNAREVPSAYQVQPRKADVLLEKIMTLDGKELTPDVVEPIGSEITYTTYFRNQGNWVSHNLSIIDPIQDRTDFKLGSVVNNLGTTALKVTVSYSKDGGENCDYTPVSGGGGAPAGFDRTVNAVCWSFSGDLGFKSPDNAGSISYVGRRR